MNAHVTPMQDFIHHCAGSWNTGVVVKCTLDDGQVFFQCQECEALTQKLVGGQDGFERVEPYDGDVEEE